MKRTISAIFSLAMVLALSACGQSPCAHDYYISDYAPATYTSNGFTEYTCKQCRKSYKEVVPQMEDKTEVVPQTEDKTEVTAAREENEETTASTEPSYSFEFDIVSGHWDGTTSIGNANVGVYALDTPIKGCKKMTITASFDMKAGTHCKDWTIYARSGGRWEKVGSLYLPNGTGEGTETLKMDGTKYIDAVTLAPTVPGSYSWSWGLVVYNVEEAYT